MPRKQYEDQFRKDTVNALEHSGKTVGRFSREINIPESTLNKWLVKFGSNKNQDSKSELEVLKRQLYEVTMERDILKKSIAIFAKTQR